jgi:hypothetical protein
MRLAFAITGAKCWDNNLRIRQIHNSTIVFAFQPRGCKVVNNVNNIRMLKQIINMPMQPFLFSAMARYSGFQAI